MGSFLTNIQVRGGDDPAQTHQRIVQAIQAIALKEGLVPAGAASASRTVIIGPPGPWIAVYDEATESQDTKLLATITKALSKEAGGFALSILVHDSDVLELLLFRDGKPVDGWCNRPDYFGKKRRGLGGKPNLWTGVLAKEGTPDQVRQLFATNEAFVETLLAPLAGLVGGDPQYFSVGFNYLEDANLVGLTRLAFTRQAEPQATTPPTLKLRSWTPMQEMEVGQPLQTRTSVENTGESFTGVVVELSGSAISEGLVAIDGVHVSWMDGPRARSSDDVTRRSALPTLEKGVLHAVFNDVPFPFSSSDNALDHTRALRLIRYVAPTGRTIKAGSGNIVLKIRPMSSQGTEVVHETTLNIDPAHRMPRTASPHSGDGSTALDKPYFVVGLVSLAGQPQETRDLLATAAAEWLGRVILTPAVFHVTSHKLGTLSFKKSPLPKEEIPDSTAWKKALGSIQPGHALSVQLRPYAQQAESLQMTPEAFLVHVQHQLGAKALSSLGSHGVHFEHRFVLEEDEKKTPVTFVMWTSTGGQHPRLNSLKDGVVGIIDKLAELTDIHQAFLAEWNWFPEMHSQFTPYESACGLSMGAELTHDWCRQYLRGVSQTLWLNAEMLARVDETRLSQLGSVAPLRHATRLNFATPNLTEIEEALDPLLPREDNWVRVLQAERADPGRASARREARKRTLGRGR